MRVAVAGGAGFIGTRLVPVLADLGCEVTVIDALAPEIHGDTLPKVDARARLIVGDVRDGMVLRHIGHPPDVLVNLVARTGVGQSMYESTNYADVNCVGTAALLDYCLVPGGTGLVVTASSRAVYGEGRHRCSKGHEFTPLPRSPQQLAGSHWDHRCPTCSAPAAAEATAEDAATITSSAYGATKLFQEQLTRSAAIARGVRWVNLRFFNVYGPGQALRNPYTGILGTFARNARAGRASSVFEDGEMLRDFVHVDDVVTSVKLAVLAEGGISLSANVGSGTPVTIGQLAIKVADLMSAPEPIITGQYRLGDIRHCFADPSFSAAALGYSAAVTLDDGLAEYLEWFSHQPNVEAVDSMADLDRHGFAGRSE